MKIHIFEHPLVMLPDFGNLLVNLVEKPVVILDDFPAVKISDALVNETLLEAPIELSHQPLHLLNMPLYFNVRLPTNPRSALHELGAFLVARVNDGFNGPQSLFEQLILLNKCASLPFDFIFNELLIALEGLEIFFAAVCDL